MVLLVPDPVGAEVEGLRRALGDPSLGRIPAHLTLVPPVNVRQEALEEVMGSLASAAAATAPLELSLGPVRSFWPQSPVVYLAVSGDLEALGDLRQRVTAGPLGRPAERPFVPHVTLAQELEPGAISAAVRALGSFRARLLAERLHLLEEGPGRVWQPLADFSLGARRVVGTGGLAVEVEASQGPGPGLVAWAARQAGSDGPAVGQGFVLVARREGSLAGLAEGRLLPGECLLEGVVVDQGLRGQGVGSQLLSSVEALAGESGCERCWALAPAGSRAESFYRSRGWEPAYRLPAWRQGRDWVRLRRVLSRTL